MFFNDKKALDFAQNMAALITLFLPVFGLLCTALAIDQFNLTGSQPAAILGKSFNWTCSMFIPPGHKIRAVSFSRNDIRAGIIGYTTDGSCAASDLNPRYTYLCESDNDFSLVIPPENMTEYEANTTWRCEYYGSGWLRSPDITLRIAVFVQNVTIVPTENPLTLIEETKTIITCSVNDNAYPPPTVQWYIGDTILNVTGKEIELMADKDNDAKILLCKATNNNESLSTSTVLNILYKPIITIAPSPLLTLNYGETLSVNCLVLKSNPAKILEYTWSIPGREGFIGRESNFTIVSTALRDNQSFQCTARNSVGTSEPSFVKVIVLLVPPRPQYVKVFCCNTHAEVVWVTSIYGPVEQKSFIQFKKSAQRGLFSNTTTGVFSTQEEGLYTARVNNLHDDNTYIFRVVTVNQYGSVNSNNASCQIQVNPSQSALSIAATVGGTVGGLVILLLVVITAIIIIRLRRRHDLEERALKTPSGQTKYETQEATGSVDHEYHEISKDMTAAIKRIDEYEEIKSKNIDTPIELEKIRPRTKAERSDDVNAYYSNVS